MSHAVAWTCRACRFVLGKVRAGVLYPIVLVESADGRGVVRVRCPSCGRSKAWYLSSLTAVTDGSDEAS